MTPSEHGNRRVVVTGMGLISPSGNELQRFWSNVVEGKSAAARVSRFDPSHLPVRIAAEVRDFLPSKYMSLKLLRRVDRSTQYAIAASKLALTDSGLDIENIDSDRIGVVEGTTVSGMQSMFKGQTDYIAKGITGLNPFTVINAYCGEGSGKIAYELGIHGHATTFCSGCSSGNDAVGYALQLIREDDIDVMIAGSTDDTMSEPMFAGFSSLKVMSNQNKIPQTAMRPFNKQRDGFVLGEGAGFLVLEELSHAKARSARIYAEVVSHARSCEAYHFTNPHPEGFGMQKSIQKALKKGRLNSSEVQYINAHGTATDSNDPIETKAIKAVFKAGSHKLQISSTKPITGHLMGAAGTIETIISILSLYNKTVPPTINLTEPDPLCDLDYIANQSRSYPLDIALNLNVGFGGKNSCLILRSFNS